jgi:hypothetical protein
MNRPIAEQADEIRELEARIEMQRAVLQKLRDEAAGKERKDDVAAADKMQT